MAASWLDREAARRKVDIVGPHCDVYVHGVCGCQPDHMVGAVHCQASVCVCVHAQSRILVALAVGLCLLYVFLLRRIVCIIV